MFSLFKLYVRYFWCVLLKTLKYSGDTSSISRNILGYQTHERGQYGEEQRNKKSTLFYNQLLLLFNASLFAECKQHRFKFGEFTFVAVAQFTITV